MDGGDVAVAPPNKNEVGAVVTELIPNIDTSYESKRQSSEISDPISVDLEHADSQEDLRMANSPITEPVKASPPPSLLPPRSRVGSESLYLLDHNMPPHFPILMNHYPVQVLMPPVGPVQTEAIPTDGHGINDMDNVNSHHRSASSPTNNLSALIQHQMEYYFSRDNLQNDSYLLSQMDEDQFVAIQTVAGFNQIKKLTTDIKLIVEAIKNSPCLQIDDTGTKVRANVIRSVIILREIPESTSIEDVKNLFNSSRCPKFVSCEFAHNDSWYVSFDTETEAREAYRYLREEVREFLGKPIYARIKGKTLQRNTYNKGSKPTTPHSQPQQQSIFPFPPPLQPAPIMLYPTLPPWPPQPQPFFEHPNVPYMVNGYPPGPGGYHHHHAGHLANFNRSSISGNHRNRGAGGRSYSQGDQPTAPVMQQQHNSHNNNSSNSHSTQTLPPRYNKARENNDDSRKGSRMRNSRRRDDYSDKPLRQQNKHLPKIDLVEPSQFPPLVSQPTSNGTSTSQSSQQGNASEDGYAQAASVKGKKITPPSLTTTTATTTPSSTMVTATTPVSNDKLTTSKLTSTTVTTTAQLPASSNNAAEVKSAPVPTPPPATPPKSTQKVIPTTAAKIGKQEPSKPAAAKPSRADKDASSRNGIKTKSSDNSKSSHHSSKASRRDKKKLESKASHQQPVKGSPQMDKKQIIPLPPSPPTADSTVADKVDLKDASKPEKLSYALVAQKAKSKPGDTSQPGSPPEETSNEPLATSQPCSPEKSKDTVPT